MLFIILALTNFENAVIQYVGLHDTQLTITKPKNTKRKETKKKKKKVKKRRNLKQNDC